MAGGTRRGFPVGGQVQCVPGDPAIKERETAGEPIEGLAQTIARETALEFQDDLGMVADAGRPARHDVERADRPINTGQVTATARVGQGKTQRGCP